MTDDNATRLHITPVGARLIAGDGRETLVTEPMIVGRSKDAGLVIDDDQISRRHAQLKPVADGLEVEDLGSSNGTFLNGQRLPKFIARDGDTLGFYIHSFSVSIKASGAGEFDPDATRLHLPEAPAPVANAGTPAAAAVSAGPTIPAVSTAPVVEPVTPAQPPAATGTPDVAADKPERAWWDTSDKGVEGTLLLAGAVDLDAEMTRLFNLGPAQNPRVVGMAGEYAGKTYELGVGKFVIGRDPASDIRLDSDGISVRHAQIIHEGGTWKLVNLLSSNGTFVNGERIQTAYLNSGDELRFGPVALLFQLPGGALVKAAASDPTIPAQGEKSSGNKTALLAATVGFALVLVVGALVLL